MYIPLYTNNRVTPFGQNNGHSHSGVAAIVPDNGAVTRCIVQHCVWRPAAAASWPWTIAPLRRPLSSRARWTLPCCRTMRRTQLPVHKPTATVSHGGHIAVVIVSCGQWSTRCQWPRNRCLCNCVWCQWPGFPFNSILNPSLVSSLSGLAVIPTVKITWVKAFCALSSINSLAIRSDSLINPKSTQGINLILWGNVSLSLSESSRNVLPTTVTWAPSVANCIGRSYH